MPRYASRKPIKKQKIELPLHLPTLDPTALSKYKLIFIVDLQSFSNKSCNRILNQALFGKVKDESEVVILVVIKSKFSPMCRECGIGKRDDKSLFLKDRFIKEGNGRVLFQLDSSVSSLLYRKELSKFVYKHNTNIIILSEDRQYGYSIIGSDVPNYDTEIYNQYFETFDQQETETTEIKTTATTDSSSPTENVTTATTTTTTTATKESQQQQQQHHKTKEEQIEELQIKTSKKIEKWIKDRIEKGDTINLPKTIESLEKSIQPFCKITHCFSNNADIIKKLSECGDIKICETCQTCKPTSINLENQFYFSYLSLSQEDYKQFDWLLKKIITEYTKTPTNQVPIPLVNINKFTLSERVEIKTSIIIDYLIKNKTISLKNDQKPIKNNDIDHSSNFESGFDDYFSTNLTISSYKSSYSSTRKLKTPTKTTATTTTTTASSGSNYSSPRKITTKGLTISTSTTSTPKKNYSSSKYSYTSTSNNSNYYGNNDDTPTYKGKIIYNGSN
ncbi:hypothetical protein ACTFIU_011205 [Dictyostelium citrinum]